MDLNGNILAIYYTGNLIPSHPDDGLVWRQYGFAFQNTDNHTVIIRISNTDTGGANDFVMDDIEIRFCAPPVELSIGNTTLCEGTVLNAHGTYVDDCTFNGDIKYRLEYRNHHIDSTWREIDSGNNTVDCENREKLTLPFSRLISRGDEGYYRLLVSSPERIDDINCRAASDSIDIRVAEQSTASDIRIDVCPSPERAIHLTSYLDSLAYNTVKWTKLSSYAPNLLNPKTGTINIAEMIGTYKYKYVMTSVCEPDSAIAYIHPLKNKLVRYIDTIVVCKDEKQSRSIQINQILGLNTQSGTWAYRDNATKRIENNLRVMPSTSSYYGAMIFNAYQAWEKAMDANETEFSINYRGDDKAMHFVFYYSSDDLCIGQLSNKEIVIVVTDKIF
jgi:hypothetical protein